MEKLKYLFIFVEGNDDERFFKKLIEPIFEANNCHVNIIKYAQEKIEKIDKYIKSIKSQKFEYLFISDINKSPCITGRKKEVKEKYKSIDEPNISIVIKEIESWYLAGLDEKNSKKLKIPYFEKTNEITKEQFNKIKPKKFDSDIDFKSELLNYYCIEIAKKKNSSFNYFFKNYVELNNDIEIHGGKK